jgi:hypothetical protein
VPFKHSHAGCGVQLIVFSAFWFELFFMPVALEDAWCSFFLSLWVMVVHAEIFN